MIVEPIHDLFVILTAGLIAGVVSEEVEASGALRRLLERMNEGKRQRRQAVQGEPATPPETSRMAGKDVKK